VFGGSGRVMPEDTVFSGYNVPKGVGQPISSRFVSFRTFFLPERFVEVLSMRGKPFGFFKSQRSVESVSEFNAITSETQKNDVQHQL
jgi:hypothetical protein